MFNSCIFTSFHCNMRVCVCVIAISNAIQYDLKTWSDNFPATILLFTLSLARSLKPHFPHLFMRLFINLLPISCHTVLQVFLLEWLQRNFTINGPRRATKYTHGSSLIRKRVKNGEKLVTTHFRTYLTQFLLLLLLLSHSSNNNKENHKIHRKKEIEFIMNF